MHSDFESIPANACRESFGLRDTIAEGGGGMPIRFTITYLRKSSIVIAPFTDDYRFHYETARALSDACTNHGYESGYAIPLLDISECCYRLDFTAKNLAALNDVDVMPVEFLLLDQERRFAIIAADNLNTIAGPRGFVERAIGMTIEEAWQEFNREYIEHEGYSSALRDGWRELVKYYHTTK